MPISQARIPLFCRCASLHFTVDVQTQLSQESVRRPDLLPLEEDADGKTTAPPCLPTERAGMTAELTQTMAEHGISSSADMSTDEALVYRLLDSVAADGGLTEDAKKEVRVV